MEHVSGAHVGIERSSCVLWKRNSHSVMIFYHVLDQETNIKEKEKRISKGMIAKYGGMQEISNYHPIICIDNTHTDQHMNEWLHVNEVLLFYLKGHTNDRTDEKAFNND